MERNRSALLIYSSQLHLWRTKSIDTMLHTNIQSFQHPGENVKLEFPLRMNVEAKDSPTGASTQIFQCQDLTDALFSLGTQLRQQETDSLDQEKRAPKV